MAVQLDRPAPVSGVLASFIDEAPRLRAFVPPFRFTSFFSPEDTLLCAIAAETALAHARPVHRGNGQGSPRTRIAELTTGSGLVGLHLVRIERGSMLAGLDLDRCAVDTASHNARLLGVHARARFERADLWSDRTDHLLNEYEPDLIVCNPPYVPEPKRGLLDVTAGAGPDGTAHLMRTLELAALVQPRALALSWCSLSDPAKIVRKAANCGYALNSLFVVAIADGEYSGSVHEYLRSIANCYISESPESLEHVAPDGSGRFAYLLMAGDFSQSDYINGETSDAVESIAREFASRGVGSLSSVEAPMPVRAWILDRWDELRLRAMLH